jgi:hypothetical protein
MVHLHARDERARDATRRASSLHDSRHATHAWTHDSRHVHTSHDFTRRDPTPATYSMAMRDTLHDVREALVPRKRWAHRTYAPHVDVRHMHTHRRCDGTTRANALCTHERALSLRQGTSVSRHGTVASESQAIACLAHTHAAEGTGEHTRESDAQLQKWYSLTHAPAVRAR